MVSNPVRLSIIVSGGNLDATGASTLAMAGKRPTPNSVVPDVGAASKIADVDRWEPDVNLTSPLTILTVTYFSNKLEPAV